MINPNLQNKMAAARVARSQDKRVPFLINIEDGRLMPNVPTLSTHRNYRPYLGDLKASKDERMLYLRTGAHAPSPNVIGSANGGGPVLDLGKASKEELVQYAHDEHNTQLSVDTDIRTLRKQVLQLVEAATAALG
jgi:hypothetical protein